jgi:hypothetical protein
MSSNDNSLEPIRRFRLMAVRGTVLLTAIVAVAAYFYDPLAAQGVLLGGIAGTLGFWIIAVRLEKIVLQKPQNVKVAALTMSTLRFAMYGAVLYKTFSLDRENYVGLIGGVIGIMLIRLVLVVVAVFGLDQRGRTTDEDTPDETGE